MKVPGFGWIHQRQAQENQSSSNRFIELDIFRGIAIVYMMFHHVLWDLDYFGIWPLNPHLYQFNQLVPLMFFVLIGICLSISFNKKQDYSNRFLEKHLLKRGLWIFGLGMIITAVTLVFMPERPILFGVLHCIGFSIILSIPLLKLKTLVLFPGLIMVLLGVLMAQFSVENPTVVHLLVGLHPIGFWQYTIDYFPLFPWFGVALLGVFLGNIFYKDGQRQFHFPDLSGNRSISFLSWMGKHSLEIYLLHQPVIAGILGLYITM